MFLLEVFLIFGRRHFEGDVALSFLFLKVSDFGRTISKGEKMNFVFSGKYFSQVPISQTLGKVVLRLIIGVGMFCVVLGMIVKDDYRAVAQELGTETSVAVDDTLNDTRDDTRSLRNREQAENGVVAPDIAGKAGADAASNVEQNSENPSVLMQNAENSEPNDISGVDKVSQMAATSDGAEAALKVEVLLESNQKQSVQSVMEAKRQTDETSILSRIMSIVGIFGFLGIAWLLSDNRKKVLWKLVAVGTVIQLIFAVFILWTPVGKAIFSFLNDAVTVLLDFTTAGTTFLFSSFVTGEIESPLINTAMSIMPPIIFFSSLMTVLYHLGVMQWIVKGMAVFMMKFMGVSGAESLSSVANIFVGMTEAPLVVKPYVEKMTKSELFAIMSGGMATVAGGVMASYVAMLQPFFPDIAGHLIAASVMSAPASLVIAKIMVPETETPETMGHVGISKEKLDANVIDAAARGAGEGLSLAMNVGAMLLAFVALIALINFVLGLPSRIVNDNTFEHVKSYVVQEGGSIASSCEANFSKVDTIGCTHSALMELARIRHIAIEPELGVLKGDQMDRIAQTDAVYRAVLDKSGAIVAANSGDGASLEKKSLWPLLSLESILGWIFFPIAFLMGVPLQDCFLVGQLLGEKTAINEFVAYLHLSQVVEQLSYRSVVISTYALCGFANFGSIAIQIGGIGGMAPSRRSDIAKYGIKAMIAGSIAAFMTATIAGALI